MSAIFLRAKFYQLNIVAAAQWEDGYEQEDPVVPEETIFKSSANRPGKLKDALRTSFTASV